MNVSYESEERLEQTSQRKIHRWSEEHEKMLKFSHWGDKSGESCGG